jgi:glycosyltransferase involved in cell wall biosynthesis
MTIRLRRSTEAGPVRPRFADDQDSEAIIGGESSWAHASGWALLSGTRHTMSCVLPCRNQAGTMAKLVPILSDTLTECGYPWELLMIDHGSDDGTAALIASWAELPGFRRIELTADAPRAQGVMTGLMLARGDAIILFNADVVHSPTLIPHMVLKWEAGAWIVLASKDEDTGRSLLSSWDEAQALHRVLGGGVALPADMFDLSLIDRRLLDRLIKG